MNHLSAAKSALRAEIKHVQAGLSFYQERVEALNEALHQLDALEEVAETELEPADKKKPSRPRKAKAGSARAARKAKPKVVRGAAVSGRLPSTGGDFFPGLLSERGQTAPEILQAAAARLHFKLTPEERAQLRNRMVATLNTLLKSGRIGSEGSGRQRVYFRAE